MGVHNLTKLLDANAPGCIKKSNFENYFSRRVAVDASMHMYQFMVVVGRFGEQGLTSRTGEETSHLQGMFYRTVRMLEAGIKPVYVFDGTPPELKGDELTKRKERKLEAEQSLKEAVETGDQEAIEKFSKRAVRINSKQNDECKRLLRLMGVPVIEAPSEAEAQCAEMCRSNLVYAVATEDMDALTFGAPRLVRNLMAVQSKQKDVMEFNYEEMLQELNLTTEQFVDLCILSGCDYCTTIRGVGSVTALKMIREHGSIEKVIEMLQSKKELNLAGFNYQAARQMFLHPEVHKSEDLPELKWTKADADALVEFLVHEKSFSEERVRRAVERINASRGKGAQSRLESFFTPNEKRKSDVKPHDDNEKSKSSKKQKTKKSKK
eukprot:g7798.t1